MNLPDHQLEQNLLEKYLEMMLVANCLETECLQVSYRLVLSIRTSSCKLFPVANAGELGLSVSAPLITGNPGLPPAGQALSWVTRNKLRRRLCRGLQGWAAKVIVGVTVEKHPFAGSEEVNNGHTGYGYTGGGELACYACFAI